MEKKEDDSFQTFVVGLDGMGWMGGQAKKEKRFFVVCKNE
jgi:hypothetical protein